MIFNNRFNNKKVDPLVEAVKQAQQDGDLRRQAIAAVNEEFGVFNRNAVIREHLAAYDARIEEAYKCMKEGKPLSPKQQKMASLAGDPKKIDAADLASLRKGAKIGAMKEATMTGIKLKANKGEEGLDVMYKSPRMKKPEKLHTINKAHRGRWGTDDAPGIGSKASAIDSVRTDAAYLKAKKRAEQRGYDMKRYDEETIEEAVSRKHFQQVADLIKGHESQEKRNELASHHASIFAKQNPRFDHGRFHKAAGSTAHEAPKKMDEAAYSAKAARAGKDIGKPGKSFSMIAKKAGERYGSEERGKKVAGAILAKIRAKHMKEENLEELSAFGSAFKAAREAGKSTFSMGGKSYTTAMKGAPSAKPTPTPPSRPAGLGTSASVGEKGLGVPGGTVALDRPANRAAMTSIGSAQADSKPETAPPRSAPIPGQKSPSPVNQADTINKSGGVAPIAPPKVAPLPPSRPADLGGPSAPAKPMQNPDQNITKVMKESVQVGENKYRIV